MQAPAPVVEARRQLFERYLRGDWASRGADTARISPRPKGAIVPLSLAQEQLWLREQMLGGAQRPYNESVTIRASSPLNATVVERCLADIVRRHEIWRTTFDTVHGQPVQTVNPAPINFPLRVIDLRTIPEAQREAEFVKLSSEAVRQVFDLRRGPLLRAMLVTLTETDQRLFIVAHLSILDGVSVYQVLPLELAVLYKAFSAGEASPLEELPIQYADYAYWQRQWLRGEELEKQLTYWREQFAGDIPVLEWPAYGPKATGQTYRGAIDPFKLRQYLTEELKRVSRYEGVTLFTILVASLGALLYHYTHQSDVLIGTPSPAGRKRPETRGMLGYFLNPVVLRLDLSGNPTFRELMKRVQKVTAEAISYDDVPIEVVAKELCLKTASHDNPIFTIAISLQPQIHENGMGWQVTSMDAESGGSVWGLYLAFIDTANGLAGRAQYNPDIFEAATISQTLGDLQALMTSVADDPGRYISTLLPNLTNGAGAILKPSRGNS
jgi:hypothetical protein